MVPLPSPPLSSVRKPLYFFLLPSFWLGTGNVACCEARSHFDESKFPANDPDVMEEELALKQVHSGRGPTGPVDGLEIQGLIKSFPSRNLCGGKPFHAVKGNWFRMEEGKLFCLLGPNGAGKTTTINSEQARL